MAYSFYKDRHHAAINGVTQSVPSEEQGVNCPTVHAFKSPRSTSDIH
ncbi:MAG: hypothetical protein ABUL58_05925 [Steroidobacter sp.]